MKENLEQIWARIHRAAMAGGRNPETVRLVAVTKTVPPDRIKSAIMCGATIFGENYIQEAREKMQALSGYPVSWHFIGRLQSNKAKYAVKLFDLIHTVDNVKLATELDRQAKKIGKIQDILLQVNLSDDSSKSGVRRQDVFGLIEAVTRLENLALKGLMTMPPYFEDPEKARPFFAALCRLRDDIRNKNFPRITMEELSMGMTGDFEAAIEEGATLVRIGTAIFGSRP